MCVCVCVCVCGVCVCVCVCVFQSAVTGGLDSKEKDLSVCSSTDSFIRKWFILYWRVWEASETLSRVANRNITACTNH